VIWTKYRHALAAIQQAFPGSAVFHGGLSETARNGELDRWRRGEARLLVATQAAGGHGLDLTRARYAVFYANGFKYAERLQAEDRQHRIGQTRKVLYISLWAEAKIEERIAGALYSKGNALRQFRDEVDKVKGNRKDGLKRLLETL
jgi:SNF2 family DNA or RNA helicase